MSNDLLEEYKAYYKSRADRYANNPDYKFSYEAEMNLSKAMQSCNTLEEFKDKIGDLNEKCAIALVKDESLLEKNFYDKFKEIYRIKSSVNILAKVDECKTALDVAQMVVEETNKTSIEISMDEAHRQFYSDWDLIDDVIAYENAVVPDKYKNDMQKSAKEIAESINKNVEFIEENNESWQSGWKIIPDKNMEYRHFRLIPYSEEDTKNQLDKYKLITNR